MNKILHALPVLLLTGCTLLEMEQTVQTDVSSAPQPAPRFYPHTPMTTPSHTEQQEIVSRRLPSSFAARYTHKTLGDYAEQLALQMATHGEMLPADRRVAVASFVMLDESLKQTGPVGNILAENLLQALQKSGASVVDVRLTGNIQLGADGERVFSRDASELSRSYNLTHIVSGTLQPTPNGLKVFARMMSLDNKQVVASADVLIPYTVLDSMQAYAQLN